MKGLGQKIKSLRKEMRLTLLEVAQKSGIDQATLSRIENGKMVGTLQSHLKIAEALGRPLADLYDRMVGEIDQAKDKIAREKFLASSRSSQITTELLTSSIHKKRMIPTLVRIKKNAKTSPERLESFVEKFIYILKGSVNVALDGEKHSLREGEGFYFGPSSVFSLQNTAGRETRILCVTSGLSFVS